MRRLIRVLAFALAFLPSLAAAQLPPPSFPMSDGSYHGANATPTYCSNGIAWVPCPPLGAETAATSTAQQGTVTSTAAVATSGTATIAAGVATVGPMTPQLGRSIRVLLKGTWAGTVYIGSSTDGCATINPLTISGQPWATFTGNANEDVDTPHLAGVVYCARATITSGTLTYAVRQ